VRLTPLGRLAVWLRFTPLGEVQRKAAAVEYGEKMYRSHLEYYEIDCSEQSAILGLIDIFGTAKARLKRLNGGNGPDAIIPGSVLDMAAQRICPALEDETDEKESEVPNPSVAAENEPVTDKLLSAETLQILQNLLKRIAAEPYSHEAWSLLGNTYYDADLPEDAIIAYSRALTIKPDDTDILNDQGAMYRQKGEFSKALSNFEKALKIDSYNLESLYNIGYVNAFDLNNIPGAIQIWKRYLELDKNSETARQVQSFVERYQKDKN
jgi:tetratricopeptide (TPR) repeat protein